jgi:transposase
MDDASRRSLPDDPQSLKAMIRSLAQERNEAQRQRDEAQRQCEASHQKLHALQAKHDDLYLENLHLTVELARYKKQFYGPKADRMDQGQLVLEFAGQLEARPIEPDMLPADVPEASVDKKTVRRVRSRGRRDLSQLNHLPLVEKVHALPESECSCPICSACRQQIGQEISYTIEHIPGHFERIKHIQLKYACLDCEHNGLNPNIELGEKKHASPIDKGMAGPGLLGYVATAKFADFLPLYRLEAIFAREGLEIDRGTLCLWMHDVAGIVKPVYDLMVQRVLLSHVLATDDTVFPLLQPGKARQARMWIYRGDAVNPYNVFDFTISRGRDGPARFLSGGAARRGEFTGTLLADAYGGYDGICIEKEIIKAGCWSHARRKYVDAQATAPPVAQAIVGLIGQLFAIEEQGKALPEAQRLHLRQTQSQPVLDQLRPLLLEHQQRLVPKHPMNQAIAYTLNQWSELTVFAADAQVPIHNNLAEQEMKRIALLRKNALFAASFRGGTTAAILSSITSTCRRHGINPQIYFTQLLTNLNDTPMSQLPDWLPDMWKQRQNPAVITDAHAKA